MTPTEVPSISQRLQPFLPPAVVRPTSLACAFMSAVSSRGQWWTWSVIDARAQMGGSGGACPPKKKNFNILNGGSDSSAID